MNQRSIPTRLREYISHVLPHAHGHQQKAASDFVSALIAVQSCCQATLARFFDNFEAASKRLSRLLHNARLSTQELALSHASAFVAQLPGVGAVRLSLDWTTEDSQHLLIASVRVGGRAIALFWRAYSDPQLKERMSIYEREFVRLLLEKVLGNVVRRRFVLTADGWFADVELLDLLNELGISFVIRTKSNYKVLVAGHWRRLDSLKWRGNQRRRAWGRVWYTETDPRRVYLVQARTRDEKWHWEVWHLLSNRPLSALRMAREYARRFTCEEGFRDGKRLLGFANARIKCIEAWARMFMLVAMALLMLTQMGCALLERDDCAEMLLKVRSRRSNRSELSLVRCIVELLTKDECLWRLLNHQCRLNLEAGL
jgi:hypothetical protein